MSSFSDFKSIIDYDPDCICRFNSEFKLTFVNKAFAKLLDCPADKLLGLSLKNIIRPDQKPGFFAIFEKITADDPEESFTSPRVLKDGRVLNINWTIVGIFDEKNVLSEYQGVGRDITELTRLNEELQSRNAELEAFRHEMRIVLDAMPCKIWYKDDKNTILRVNKTAADSMGLKVQDIEGANTYDLFGDVAKQYHDDDLKVINTGKPLLGYTERYVPKEGEAGWIRTDKIPFDDPFTGGKRILVVATDITELKEQQAMLETINKNLDDFASMTSHDLQAPLRHITLFAEMFEAEYNDILPKDGQSYIHEIIKSAESMRGLIKGFLKFMRASPEGVDFERVNMGQLMQEVAQDFDQTLSEFKGDIRLPDLDIFVKGEKGLLRQILFNLIENAIKYRDLSRPLKVNITAQQKEGQWFVTVSDNGIGIPEGDASHIFNLFNRSKPHSHREGSGIGLALCKRLVTLHGGQISAVRNSAGGSDFIFNLNAIKG